jgi:hypothetical protein
MGYAFNYDPSKAEPDSDVYVVLHEGLVSLTPMSLDLTSRTDPYRLRQLVTGERVYAEKSQTRKLAPQLEELQAAINGSAFFTGNGNSNANGNGKHDK